MYSPWTEYPADLVLDFDDDYDYRIAVVRLFLSRAGKLAAEADVAASSCDDYDERAAQTFVNAVVRETSTVPEMTALFTKAAADVMSEDPEIGVVVLLSYDNVVLFHSCLAAFFSNTPFADNEGYIALAQKYNLV